MCKSEKKGTKAYLFLNKKKRAQRKKKSTTKPADFRI